MGPTCFKFIQAHSNKWVRRIMIPAPVCGEGEGEGKFSRAPSPPPPPLFYTEVIAEDGLGISHCASLIRIHRRISDIFATVAESSLKRPATIFSISSPLTGSTSSLDFTASDKNSLSFIVSLKALRSI